MVVFVCLESHLITFEVGDPPGPPASVAAAKSFGSEGIIDVDEIPECRRRNGITPLRGVHGCACGCVSC